MLVQDFIEKLNAEFYCGVPDSQLKALCDYLIDRYGTDPKHHVIAANEGNCVASAAGYHLSTGKVPVVYMQNSGEGNAVNPIASLLNDKVYAIPCIFVIGWRGEPGIKDEPQHIFQGEITLKLLEDMQILYHVIDEKTNPSDLDAVMREFCEYLSEGKQTAFVIRKNALKYEGATQYHNKYTMTREDVIERIVETAGNDRIISTTGKASRELFEIREKRKEGHENDFLTVGCMGHASSIALQIAVQRPDKRVWCLDGDGAALMHMGAMAVIGSQKPSNMIHVLLNNQAHETVGGMPTVAEGVCFRKIAEGCGYPHILSVEGAEELGEALKDIKERKELCFLEVKCALGARADLGRPTTTALENKLRFMQNM
ncbi:MAG: phosphonopyruvate decarboxylase [Lachnospiraceae bacterium]|nr:phosphonopyruvate decarboxylase [Lachnospiraceae bacterium]